jgi:hypothetical protein
MCNTKYKMCLDLSRYKALNRFVVAFMSARRDENWVVPSPREMVLSVALPVVDGGSDALRKELSSVGKTGCMEMVYENDKRVG